MKLGKLLIPVRETRAVTSSLPGTTMEMKKERGHFEQSKNILRTCIFFYFCFFCFDVLNLHCTNVTTTDCLLSSVVEEVNILSGRQFALEIGFHFSVITIIQEQVRTMKLDTQRINDIPHKECKLLSSCIACLTSCITLKTMLRDVLDPKHKILQHMEWIMSVAIKGGSNMSPIMLTNIWIFCRQVRELFPIHVGCTRDATSSTDQQHYEHRGSDHFGCCSDLFL